MVEKQDPERFKKFLETATRHATQRYSVYQQLAGVTVPRIESDTDAAVAH
jgi:hypothetical protein